MSSSYSGGQLIRCTRCQHSFTQTNWRLHGHNPEQAICQAHLCRRRAVGHRFTGGVPQLLCGGHLLEAQRGGGEVTFVDGRVCRVCEGHGSVNAQEIRTESPGGEWRTCAECLGTGYDPTLRSAPSPRRVEPRAPRAPRPARRETRAEKRAREAEEQATRREWFDREVAPLAEDFVDPIVAWQQAREGTRPPKEQPLNPHQPGADSRARPPNPPSRQPSQAPAAGARDSAQEPRLAPGSRPADVRAVERELRFRRRRRRRGNPAGFLIFAGLVTLAGAAVGALFIYPVLPDDALVLVNDLQHWVSERFAQ